MEDYLSCWTLCPPSTTNLCSVPASNAPVFHTFSSVCGSWAGHGHTSGSLSAKTFPLDREAEAEADPSLGLTLVLTRGGAGSQFRIVPFRHRFRAHLRVLSPSFARVSSVCGTCGSHGAWRRRSVGRKAPLLVVHGAPGRRFEIQPLGLAGKARRQEPCRSGNEEHGVGTACSLPHLWQEGRECVGKGYGIQEKEEEGRIGTKSGRRKPARSKSTGERRKANQSHRHSNTRFGGTAHVRCV